MHISLVFYCLLSAGSRPTASLTSDLQLDVRAAITWERKGDKSAVGVSVTCWPQQLGLVQQDYRSFLLCRCKAHICGHADSDRPAVCRLRGID